MLDINLNLYRIFYIVAQSKSYTDASNKLNITVPAISKSIQQLESVLDTQLFFRENNGVKLTGSGNELFEYVDKGLTTLGLGERVILEKNELNTGEIVIGCPSHIATFYLMDYIEKARIENPNLKIRLLSGLNAEELLNLLEKHKIDFAIDSTQINPTYNDIIIEKLKMEQNVFISSEPLKINNVKELEKLKFILPFEYTSTTKRLIENLKKHGVCIKADMEVDITELRINAVKRGLGIGYVMQDAVENEIKNKEIHKVELPIDLPSSQINLIYVKGQLRKTDKKFIKEYLGR